MEPLRARIVFSGLPEEFDEDLLVLGRVQLLGEEDHHELRTEFTNVRVAALERGSLGVGFEGSGPEVVLELIRTGGDLADLVALGLAVRWVIKRVRRRGRSVTVSDQSTQTAIAAAAVGDLLAIEGMRCLRAEALESEASGVDQRSVFATLFAGDGRIRAVFMSGGGMFIGSTTFPFDGDPDSLVMSAEPNEDRLSVSIRSRAARRRRLRRPKALAEVVVPRELDLADYTVRSPELVRDLFRQWNRK